MATYLPGVTDYIPDIQPFKPDLNFYQAALQTKETQYKAGYDKISNVYGSLLNADMLREPNIKKRDEFFKKIEGEIQRMSTVDLSLQENVSAAYQVFQPLIDDKNIIKDIAFTKSYRTQKRQAENSRMSADGKWWDTGNRALDYMAEEFAMADDPTAQGMSNPRYVPYTDYIKKGMSMIKDMGINVQSVSWDTSGRYIVTTKNGQRVTVPLYNVLYQGLGNDPMIKDMFTTQAYVKRKDYMKENAGKFNGDETQAELEYLNLHRKEADDLNLILQKQIEDELKGLSIDKQIVEDQIKKEGALPSSKKKGILQMIEELTSATEATKGHVEAGLALTNPNELSDVDIKVLRSRVDGAVANIELSKSMMGLAKTWASLNSVQTVEKDPYAFSSYENQLTLGRMHAQYLINSQLKAEQYGYDKNLKALDAFLKNEKSKANKKYGNPDNNIWKPTGTGQTDASLKLTGVNQEVESKVGKSIVDRKMAYLNETYKLYDGYRKSNNPATQVKGELMLKQIFGEDMKMPTTLVSDKSDYSKIYDSAVKANANNDGIISSSNNLRLGELKKDVDEWQMVQGEIEKTGRKNNLEGLKYLRDLEKDNDSPDADLFIDKDGTVASEQEFTQKYIQKYGTDNGASKRYKGLNNHLIDVLDRNVPGVKAYNSAFTASGGAGVIYAENVSIGLDPADPESEGYRTMVSVRKDILNPLATISNPDAKPIVEDFLSDFVGNTYKDTDDKRPSGTLTYLGLVGDRNHIGYSLKMDRDWLNANKGTDKNHGLTWDLYKNGKWNDEVTFTLPRAAAQSSIAKASDLNPADYLLGLGPIVVDEYSEYGGIRAIEKTNDGSYVISGTMKHFDELKGEWGEFARVDYAPRGISAQEILNVIKEVLKANATKQIEVEKKVSAEKGTRDPNKLLQK